MRYSHLVEVYQDLGATTKKLEKRDILAVFLKKVTIEDLDEVMYLIQGRVFPPWDGRKIGFSSRLMLKAIAKATGISSSKVETEWKKIGDLGKVAEKLIKKKTQRTLASKTLTVKKVFDNIRSLAELIGEGTVAKKISLVAELLTNAEPTEARFVVGTILEELRIGVAEGTVRDAIAKAYDVEIKDVEKAFDSLVDYAEVAKRAKKGKSSLRRVTLGVGTPIKVMLAILVKDIPEAFKALGKPCQLEFKLDGFRLEIHKIKNQISLFTRRMENVTKQFPDVVEYVKKHVHGKSFILDSEAVGFDVKTKKFLPFQSISQRIKRKYDIAEMSKKFPVELNIFDIMHYNGKDLQGTTLKERRKILEKIVKQRKRQIVLTKKLVTANEKVAEKFYKEALEKGMEGIMLKNLNANYKPGRYVGGWVKLKPTLEPLDLVIVGAEYGTGKRAGVLSSFVLACKHGNKFLECGMMGTGIKEKKGEDGITFAELTKLLNPLITEEKGRSVKIKPKIVVEIIYGEIQKSPTYSSGFALRFPRLRRLRTKEKSAAQANTLADIKRFYKVQKGKR